MILPIVAYGHPTLRKVSVDIDKDYPDLQKLIEDMFETMRETNGVGLAAPQINKNIRLLVLDAEPFADEFELNKDEAELVMLNMKITEEFGEDWTFNEGCLSVPEVREDVVRKSKIRVEFYDKEWKKHEKEFDGILARIIQHEYDHIEGKIFTDRISPLRKMMIKKQLTNISKGNISPKYKMIFPKKRKK